MIREQEQGGEAFYNYHADLVTVVQLAWQLFGVLNDQFEFLTCIPRFSGTFSFNKPLKISFAIIKFILL